MHHGEIPSGCVIDHINRNREDDRIDNLRAVPVTLNNRNKTIDKRNSSGVPGVTYDARRKRWVAYVNRDGKQVRLGRFPSLEEAAAARAAAANPLGYLEV
ncbi:HNH endonuclease [Staphylococcus epidermidis]|nr:HNH endonuclease [Staphylococcus epidermidis]